MRYLLITLSLLLCALPASAAPPQLLGGFQAFIAVESATGSLTEGLGVYSNHPDEVFVQGCGFGLEADYDQATGNPTGRPVPEPFHIVKRLDHLTPLMLTQMVNNAQLEVACRLYASDPAGRDQLVFTLELADARLVSISGRAERLSGAVLEPYEDLKLVYRTLTVTDELTGSSSQISWTQSVD